MRGTSKKAVHCSNFIKYHVHEAHCITGPPQLIFTSNKITSIVQINSPIKQNPVPVKINGLRQSYVVLCCKISFKEQKNEGIN